LELTGAGDFECVYPSPSATLELEASSVEHTAGSVSRATVRVLENAVNTVGGWASVSQGASPCVRRSVAEAWSLDRRGACHVEHRERLKINRVVHIVATVQLRNPTEGRAYYDRRQE
jgi:hypothetical protein